MSLKLTSKEIRRSLVSHESQIISEGTVAAAVTGVGAVAIRSLKSGWRAPLSIASIGGGLALVALSESPIKKGVGAGLVSAGTFSLFFR
jgi:hypothetical protein